MKRDYNKEIYKMYEKEYNNNLKLKKENQALKLENYNLKYELKHKNDSFDTKINSKIQKVTKPLIDEINSFSQKLKNAYNEIERLKEKLNYKDYNIDKLECSNNKNSSNSGIPTSKEITKNTIKGESRTNTYNHRLKSNKKPGGQFGRKGTTLTKEKLLTKIKENNVEVNTITHYIKGINIKKETVKYKVGINVSL